MIKIDLLLSSVESGKIQTRKTPNADTLYAVYDTKILLEVRCSGKSPKVEFLQSSFRKQICESMKLQHFPWVMIHEAKKKVYK